MKRADLHRRSARYHFDGRISSLAVVLFWATNAQAAVVHVPLKSNLVLKPSEAYTVTLDATEPLEIGWRAIGEPPNIVLKSVDTCAPKAAHFGVPEANVFT
jgi:hypothetical protein